MIFKIITTCPTAMGFTKTVLSLSEIIMNIVSYWLLQAVLKGNMISVTIRNTWICMWNKKPGQKLYLLIDLLNEMLIRNFNNPVIYELIRLDTANLFCSTRWLVQN